MPALPSSSSFTHSQGLRKALLGRTTLSSYWTTMTTPPKTSRCDWPELIPESSAYETSC
jgi:hypothetical protein